MREELASELLDTIKSCSPEFFERLVPEDWLGLDVVYLQAKRWDATVGRPEIQKFAGALQGQRARKGVFITTSTFPSEATDHASGIDSKIILMDGAMLARLMIDYDIGMAPFASYQLERIDADYFAEG